MKNNFLTKSLCLLAVLCFTTSVMAVETATYVFTSKSWAATLNDEPANWISGKDGGGFSNNGVQVTNNATVSGANATSPVSFDNITKIVVTYNTNAKAGDGTLEVKIGENAATSVNWAYSGKKDGRTANFTAEFDYEETQSGTVKLTANTTTNSIYVVSIAITYGYETSAPDILADKLDLGTHLIARGESSFAFDTTLIVTGANLTESILVACPDHVTATESSLPAAGGTLHLQVSTESALLLQDSIVLTSGSTTVKVPVEAKIKQNPALAGSDATVTKGENASNVIMDGVDAYKMGVSNAGGAVILTVPAATNRIRFYAVAWSDEAGTVSVSAFPAADLGVSELTLSADAGLSGNSPYSLNALTPVAYLQEIAFEPLLQETQITLTSNTARRFFIWDVKYELGEIIVPDPVGYTVNYRDKAGSVLSSEVVPLTIPEAPVIEGFTFLYWKLVEGNIADGINVQAVYQSNNPTEMPSVVVNPDNRAQKLIRDGNVYILRDDAQYTPSGVRIK